VLKEIFAWWAARMLECLPQRLRQFDIGSDSALIVAVADAAPSPLTVMVSRIQRGSESLAGRFVLDDQGRSAIRALAGASKHRVVRLRLPSACLLEQTLLLPLGTERDMASVLGFEIDRVTPFAVEEILWQFAIEQRDRANGRLKVRLSLVPKAPWAPLLTALGDSGIIVTTVEVPRVGSNACRIDLDRERSQRETSARRRRIALASLFGAMAVTAVLLPFVLQGLALQGLNQRIADLRPAVAKAEALRQQITNGATGIDVMAAEQARIGDSLAVLTAVTTALPDDTYLTSLSLQQGHLSLAGQSGAAAKLIGLLSDNGLIHNAAFDAPITRTDQSRADIFSIRADLTAAGSPAGSGPKP
jgi:general secretion pathway protein L